MRGLAAEGGRGGGRNRRFAVRWSVGKDNYARACVLLIVCWYRWRFAMPSSVNRFGVVFQCCCGKQHPRFVLFAA